MALQANLLVLLNPLFVSRSQHGSGKPLPRPCALNVRCRGALRAERRWGRCLRGWERCDLFHHHPLGWWRHGPRLKWEKAAWRRQHGWPRSGASDGAPHRPQTSNSPPSSRPLFTIMLTCAPLPSQVARSCRLRLRLDGRWWQRRARGRSRHHHRSAASRWLPR